MEDKKYWLNKWGLRYWTNKNDKHLTAMRSYHWKDNVSFINESDGTREYVGSTTFEEFMKNEEHWHPMSKKQYDADIAALQEKHKK